MTTSAIEVNNGDTATRLALVGSGIARVGRFNVADAIVEGQLVELLSDFNPHDIAPIHALYLGGSVLPTRVRVFIDFLARRLGRQHERAIPPRDDLATINICRLYVSDRRHCSMPVSERRCDCLKRNFPGTLRPAA